MIDGISIIIPVVRPKGAERCIKAIADDFPKVPYEIIAAEDTQGIGCPEMVKRLAKDARYDWVMFLGDDTIPEPGMLDEAAMVAGTIPGGMVGLNDQIHDGNLLSTHWMCHKDILKLTGGEFFHTGYNHQFCDKELLDIAKENNLFVWAENAKLTHDHPHVRGGKDDEYYQRAYKVESVKHDLFLYIKRKLARSGVSLAVGVPITDEKVHTQFFLSFVTLEMLADARLIYPTTPSGNSDIARIRTGLCEEALHLGCTHLLMLDTDQVYHNKDLIPRLLAHGKDIVGGKVHRRYPPFDPILNRGGYHVDDKEIEQGGIVRVDSTGTGCLLIDLTKLENVEHPWFAPVKLDDGTNTGEDIGFCKKAAAAGLEIFVDCGVEIGHLASFQVNDALYQIWKKLNR